MKKIIFHYLLPSLITFLIIGIGYWWLEPYMDDFFPVSQTNKVRPLESKYDDYFPKSHKPEGYKE